MTREQAINYLFSCGFTNEQVGEVVRALTYEPTTKNDLGVALISREQAKEAIRDKFKDLPSRVEINTILNELPSVTPQEPTTKNDLGVEEVTALAEWTEKLTKECEEAYNKGYADGVKSVNICPHCGEYIGEEE